MKSALLLAVIFPLIADAAPSPAAEAITMTESSWGHQILRWRIEPDGSISYMIRTQGREPGVLGPWQERRSPPSRERYRWVANLLAPARARAGQNMSCANPMTDQAAGTVGWGKMTKLGYYAGCYEPETRSIVALLFKARKQLDTWTGNAPVTIVPEDEPAR
ncbi:hypothetical protein QH494_17915 [Sphingomonas sp. AR_OL41]|jgi:hypothetical protein|uniref:hypothetical protein n=1 Tax=Sphingomonas sp. AR_OL41 TaxID=3042729 RepID=UPI002480E4F1|nr:hypothetical protein [Sphingomonas sp. AR_OL41]MDH7974069.1 hypothetical protein [Sphingomonas sp. AR_OL41]